MGYTCFFHAVFCSFRMVDVAYVFFTDGYSPSLDRLLLFDSDGNGIFPVFCLPNFRIRYHICYCKKGVDDSPITFSFCSIFYIQFIPT